MAFETETVLNRRRLRRRLSLWRALAVLSAVVAFGLLAFASSEGAGLAEGRQIARVSLEGIITENRDQLRLLKRVADNKQVVAVILYINSPGGTTTGGEALFEAIREVAKVKPVVAQLGTIATSAAYIAGLGTDHMVAHGNTITGSAASPRPSNTWKRSAASPRVSASSTSSRSGRAAGASWVCRSRRSGRSSASVPPARSAGCSAPTRRSADCVLTVWYPFGRVRKDEAIQRLWLVVGVGRPSHDQVRAHSKDCCCQPAPLSPRHRAHRQRRLQRDRRGAGAGRPGGAQGLRRLHCEAPRPARRPQSAHRRSRFGGREIRSLLQDRQGPARAAQRREGGRQ